MTSASELFYTRRSRLGRPEPNIGSEAFLNRSFHHDHHRRHRHDHQHRHDSKGSDQRRATRLRQFAVSVTSDFISLSRVSCFPWDLCFRRKSSPHFCLPNSVIHTSPFCCQDRRPLRIYQCTNQFTSRNVESGNDTQSISNLGRLNGNERLPGAVLLARTRLVERLRGVPSSGSRQGNRISSADHQRSLVDSADGVSFFPDLTFQPVEPTLLQEYAVKPQGLTHDSINSLQWQILSATVENNETRDCGICLESFACGDTLISLPCSHDFHSSCLIPWLKTCGVCPYCRGLIT